MDNLISLTDESLMQRIGYSDHQAFATLVRRHTQRFFAVSYRLCGDVMMAEDVVQEAFLKIWNKPDLWNPEKGAKFTTWFYRVVSNQTLDQMRKRNPETGTDILEETASDNADLQDQVIQNQEESEALESAIHALPERQKLALTLCVYEDMSNKEAADVMGVGVKALESLLMRAKSGIKDHLTRTGFIRGKERRHG